MNRGTTCVRADGRVLEQDYELLCNRNSLKAAEIQTIGKDSRWNTLASFYFINQRNTWCVCNSDVLLFRRKNLSLRSTKIAVLLRSTAALGKRMIVFGRRQFDCQNSGAAVGNRCLLHRDCRWYIENQALFLLMHMIPVPWSFAKRWMLVGLPWDNYWQVLKSAPRMVQKNQCIRRFGAVRPAVQC